MRIFAIFVGIAVAISVALVTRAAQPPTSTNAQTSYDRTRLQFVERFNGIVRLSDGRSIRVRIGDWALSNGPAAVAFPVSDYTIILERAGGLVAESNGRRTVIHENDALAFPANSNIRVRPLREASIFSTIASRAL